MDNPELERSSSSPNVRVLSIEYKGATGRTLQVRLDDGSLFLLDADHPAAVELAARRDETLDDSLFGNLQAADGAHRCRVKALDYLARAEQCRQGMEMKLLRKGFERDAVAAALDRLEEQGALDDTRFAEAWVRSRLRSRPEGAPRLRAALMAKGIAGKVARDAVAAVFRENDDPDGLDALARAAEKLRRRRGITPEKLQDALVRRGFRLSDIRRYL